MITGKSDQPGDPLRPLRVFLCVFAFNAGFGRSRGDVGRLVARARWRGRRRVRALRHAAHENPQRAQVVVRFHEHQRQGFIKLRRTLNAKTQRIRKVRKAGDLRSPSNG